MQSDNANMIDEAGQLNEIIKKATKRLDEIKKKLSDQPEPPVRKQLQELADKT